MHMKHVQILIDEPLLKRLDADPEVRKLGRSEVLRRAAFDYLKRKRARHIREAYTRAYAKGRGLGAEFSDWERQGVWPEE
jgi:metal-responsive CopG/Arc/MetJ family transcriptional regulator